MRLGCLHTVQHAMRLHVECYLSASVPIAATCALLSAKDLSSHSSTVKASTARRPDMRGTLYQLCGVNMTAHALLILPSTRDSAEQPHLSPSLSCCPLPPGFRESAHSRASVHPPWPCTATAM